MPAFLDLQCPCRKLSLLAFAVLLYVAAAAPARAQVPTPTIVPGNCANSYPVRNGLQFDLVLTTQDTQPTPNYWYDDQDSASPLAGGTGTAKWGAHSEFFSAGNPGPTVSFTTICVGDDVRWEEPATQISQHTSTQGSSPTSICSTAHNENPLWDIVDCVQNPTNSLMAANTIYCPAAGTCPGSSPNPFFKTQGIFQYYCRAHLNAMEGYVIVSPYKTTVVVTGATAGVYGTTSTLVATITSTPSRGGSPNAVGTVQFFVNGSPFGSPVSVDSAGKATLSNAILPAGNDQVTAQYSGDGNKYAQSPVSSADTVTITQASATVSLNSSPNPSAPGASVTFTATVTNTDPSGIAPGAGETVDVFDSVSGKIGTMTFQSSVGNQGTYTFSTSTLSNGSHLITAVLEAGNFNSATSNVVTQLVSDFQVSISNPSGVTAPLPSTFTYNGTVTPIGGYTGSVAISCVPGSTAAPTTCTPTPASVSVTSSAAVPFTVKAGNAATPQALSFFIQGQDATQNITHAFPVTLNVGSLNLTQPNCGAVTTYCITPGTTADVFQGNPTVGFAFQVSSVGAFQGQVDLSCPGVPSGMICRFASGTQTQSFTIQAGGAFADIVSVLVGAAVTPGTYTVNVQAAPSANPALAQVKSIKVVVGSSGGTVVVGAGYAAMVDPALAGSPLKIPAAALNYGATPATNLSMLVTFDHPVASISAPAGCAVDSVNQTVNCGPVTSLAAGKNLIENIIVVPLADARRFGITTQVFCSESNTDGGPTNPIASHITHVRLRPWVHNGIPAKTP